MTFRVACTCPTCGSDYEAAAPRVDLNRNIFICRKGWRKLSPREAEIVAVLVKCFPRMATFPDLIIGIYGGGDEPENAIVVTRIYVCVIRRKLKTLGWTLVNIHGRGYRLAELEDVDG